eukprot:4402338-Prymnesium_polylepis.2
MLSGWSCLHQKQQQPRPAPPRSPAAPAPARQARIFLDPCPEARAACCVPSASEPGARPLSPPPAWRRRQVSACQVSAPRSNGRRCLYPTVRHRQSSFGELLEYTDLFVLFCCLGVGSITAHETPFTVRFLSGFLPRITPRTVWDPSVTSGRVTVQEVTP